MSPSGWRAPTNGRRCLRRVHAAELPYQLAEVPQMGPQQAGQQLFIALAPGVVIEFVTALRNAHRS